jgi:O-antigen/teichoic acid export membrane protein
MTEPAVAPVSPSPARRPGLILRNALYLVASQAIVTPLTLIINGAMGRHLGPAEYGDLYLAGTFAVLGFLLVEWGQGPLLTAHVARDHTRAGELAGTSIAFRIVGSLVVGAALMALSLLLGKDRGFLVVMALVVLGSALGTVVGGCHDVVRGFERMDFGAASYVGWQVLRLIVVVPTLLLGGRLRAVLVAQAACAAVGLVPVVRLLPRVGVTALRVRWATARQLLIEGIPFLVFGLSLALQSNVDAVLMSKLASREAVGWYAAAGKLQGALIYPVGVLIAALYPTLCRLHVEDQSEYRRTAAEAMRTTTLLVLPLAACCFLYPDVGVRLLFGSGSYGPAEDNLRILSLNVLLLYFSMPVSSCLNSSGRQWPWTITQFACVLLALGLDWWLIPHFQATRNNGGLGVCWSAVASEGVKVAVGVALLPRGIFTAAVLRKLLLAALAAGAMIGVAAPTLRFGSFVSAPLAVGAYAVFLWLTGGVDREQLAAVRAIVRRRR